MFSKDSDDDEEDEWFYDSIKRYKQLRMFDFENAIQQIELTDPRSICVVGKHKSGRHEILELSLPEKLVVASSEEGLVKNSDLKVRNGGFTVAPIIQMKSLWCKRRIIVSEESQAGASIYNLGSADSDIITKIGSLNCEIIAPRMALNNHNLVLLTAPTKKDLVVMDVQKNSVIYKMMSDSTNESENGLEPSFVSENLAALCDKSSGNVLFQDIRAGKESGNFTPAKQCLENANKVKRELWTMRTSYDNNKSLSTVNSENIKFGLVSTRGNLSIYDFRNTSVAVCKTDVGKVIEPHIEDTDRLPLMNFAPDDDTKISLSGFNGNVYIFNTSSTDQFKTMFVHDGHKKQNEANINCYVTSHAWYKENIVISASENCWLHCWQFIPESVL